MSFGYSVGDFFAAVKIIHSVSKKIKDAPEEYRRLADEVKTLGIAIQEATTATAPVSTAPGNNSRLQELGKSCHDVLVRLERELDKHGALGSSGGGSTPGSASSGSNIFKRIVGRPAKRGWQRFRFDPDEIKKVSDQLLTHLHSFNTLQLNNARSTMNSISQSVNRLHVDQSQVSQSLSQISQQGKNDSQNITSVSTGVQQLNVGQVQISQSLGQMSVRQQGDSQSINAIGQGVDKLHISQTKIDQNLDQIQLQQQGDSHNITSISQEVHQLNAAQNKMSLQQHSDSQNITSIIEGVKALKVSEARKIILAWISPVDFTSTHQDIIYRRQEGTGAWFLNSAEYQTWLHSPGETLFCPGIPGSGKTMLNAIAIDHLEAKFRKTTENVGIAYIYFSYQKEGSQGLMDVLASLLRQLCAYRHPLPAEIQELYEECTKSKHRGLTRAELVDNLDIVAQSFSQVFIFFDALDECRQDSTLLSILSEMFGLQKKRRTVNLLATSRYIPEIMSEFNDRREGKTTPVVEVRASKADVRKYLEGQSKELRPFARRDKELQGQIVSKIVDSVQGMFLLAQLHFQSMCDHTDKKSVLQALSRLQSGSNAYEVAYEEAMGRIKRQRAGPAELAFKVLAWITCATRPLRTVELQHALAVEEGEDSVDKDKITEVDDLVSYCAGLVTVNRRSGIIRLVHYTTQEYFRRARDKWFPSAEVEMAAVCLRYISFPVFESWGSLTKQQVEDRKWADPLYEYATNNWAHHLRRDWLPCKDLFERFRRSTLNVAAAAQAVPNLKGYNLGRDYNRKGYKVARNGNGWDFQYTLGPEQHLRGLTGLHLLVYFGLHEALGFFLDDSESPDGVVTNNGQTLLGWAAVYGHEQVIRSLVSRGANIEKRDAIHATTPLLLAIFHGHTNAAKLLMEMGANLLAPDLSGGNSLIIAVRKANIEVVRAILERDPTKALSVDFQTKDTALIYAAQALHLEIIQLLLQHFPDDPHDKSVQVNKLNKGLQSALSQAVWRRRDWSEGAWSMVPGPRPRMQVIRALLDAGADPDRGRDHMSSLKPCIVGALDHPELLSLLLSRGAKTSVITRWGWTPLIFTVYLAQIRCVVGTTRNKMSERFFETFDILLEYGADINEQDRCGLRSPLMFAVLPFERIVEEDILYLVKRIVAAGADLDLRDAIGKTALQHAIEWGYQTVVDFLVVSGAKVDIGVDLDVKRFKAKSLDLDPIIASYFRNGFKPRGG
ncbi:Ankyrin repeat-containing domain protein [Rhypophila decipiens]